ncbi:UNVERIFIED_CONTAM: hypothetical protein RMT77_015932 [Armadillidium vulgare]
MGINSNRKGLLFMAFVFVGCFIERAVSYPKVCSYWCKTPPPERYYCCDGDPYKPVHAGHCPPVLNTYCPSSINSDIGGIEPPKRCRDDGTCRNSEKCCFDKCLVGKFCKPAIL